MAQSTQPSTGTRRRPFTAWVLGAVLIIGALAFTGVTTGLITYGGPLIPPVAAAVALIALPFIGRWLAARDEAWPLVTGWLFLSLAILLGLIHFGLPGIALVVALLLAAAPFTLAYALDNTRFWWMSIPAYVLASLALLPSLLAVGFPVEMLGGFALLAAALPLWVIYMRDRSRTWAIVPAGVISGIAVIVLVTFSVVSRVRTADTIFYIILNVVLALVMLALWLTARRLDWALWLAIGFTGSAVLSIWAPGPAGWAALALATGVYIITRQVDATRKARTTSPPVAPPTPAMPVAPAPSSTSAPSSPSSPVPTVIQKPTPGSTPVSTTAIQADNERTAGQQARAASPQTKSPAVEFRPIDPFKSRREQAGDKTEPDGS